MHNQMYSRGPFIAKGTVYREMLTKSKYSFEKETRAMRRRMRSTMKYGDVEDFWNTEGKCRDRSAISCKNDQN